MTKHTLTIDTSEGTATIDSQKLTEFNQRALDVLEQISELTKDFKEIVEEASDATKLKKAKVSKYFKSRFDAKTKDTSELGILFSQLDEVLDGK